MSQRDIDKSVERLKGRGLATAAIVINIVAIAAIILWVVALATALGSTSSYYRGKWQSDWETAS
jgi:4-hydroxybenzoate polyprenyltransferase